MVVRSCVLFATKLSVGLVVVLGSDHVGRGLSFRSYIVSLRIYYNWHSWLVIVIMSSSVLFIALVILLMIVMSMSVCSISTRASSISVSWVASKTLAVLLVVTMSMVCWRMDERMLLGCMVAIIADVVSGGWTKWFVWHNIDWRCRGMRRNSFVLFLIYKQQRLVLWRIK